MAFQAGGCVSGLNSASNVDSGLYSGSNAELKSRKTSISWCTCGVVQVLAAMAQLEAPHVSVLTKVDLLHESIKVRVGSESEL